MLFLFQLIIYFLITYLIIYLIIPILKRKILDLPNLRSSHLIPTPRAGGIAFISIGLIGAIFNGHIRKEDMETSLKNYIEIFVLCKQCKLPEIHKYKLSKKKKGIKLKCLGCGFCGILDSDDHRLVSYIKAQISQDKKDKKDKKDKNIKK